MTLRERLRALFSPTRKLLTADASTVSAGGALGGVEWVVPRARCQYYRSDFSGLPRRRRQAAAVLAARQQEPGPQARSRVAWTDTVAHIWVWSDPTHAGAVVDGDLAWIPESLLRSPPLVDGVRLVGQIEGFEGQHWLAGTLRSSRWWASPPSLESWNRFLRGCGLTVDASVPVPQDAGWASQPWAGQGWRLPASPVRLERLAWQGLSGVLLILAGWQIAAVVAWGVARERLDASLVSLRAQASPLLEARERAEAARATLEAYGRLAAEGLSDHALMAEVVAGLPDDSQLSGWQRDRERLQVQIRSSETDPRRYVSAYQADSRLRDVSATPGREGTMQLDFILATTETATGVRP